MTSRSNASFLQFGPGEWKRPANRYRCRVDLIPEAEGGFSVIVPGLPGCVSQGETEADALAMVREALELTCGYYLDTRGVIPWLRPTPGPRPGVLVRWVVFTADVRGEE